MSAQREVRRIYNKLNASGEVSSHHLDKAKFFLFPGRTVEEDIESEIQTSPTVANLFIHHIQ